jgi:hypothetical protein
MATIITVGPVAGRLLQEHEKHVRRQLHGAREQLAVMSSEIRKAEAQGDEIPEEAMAVVEQIKEALPIMQDELDAVRLELAEAGLGPI